MEFHDTLLAEPSQSIGLMAEDPESTAYVEADQDGAEEVTSEPSPYSDDFVRVYLREMGAVSLLTRQGEIDLARRMERGKLRVRKVLSRSPLVQQMIVDLHEQVRHGETKLDHLVDAGGSDEGAKDRALAEASQRFSAAMKRNREVTALEAQLES